MKPTNEGHSKILQLVRSSFFDMEPHFHIKDCGGTTETHVGSTLLPVGLTNKDGAERRKSSAGRREIHSLVCTSWSQNDRQLMLIKQEMRRRKGNGGKKIEMFLW